ncbi:hypothetical protein PENSPDRAFT_235284 [Peniophora sp. CONT]|nr:hypothetical protein PENSPDRAFT_235284 [Peniophora sp. CONT]
MLYLHARVLMVASAIAMCILPAAAAPTELTPRRDSLSRSADSPRTGDSLIFPRRGDLDIEARHLNHGHSSEQREAYALAGADPLIGEDPEKREASKTTNANKSYPSDDIRPQPSSGITILPRMFNFSVDKSKDEKRHLRPAASQSKTATHHSAVPSQTPKINAITSGASGFGAVL